MKKNSKIIITLMLVLIMLLATACSDSGDLKQPSKVGGDSDTPFENVEVTIAETILYDADGITVTAKGYNDSITGPEVKVLVENNSDKDVLVTADSVSVNGYMMPYAGLYAEVAAGKKSNEVLSIMSSELEQSGIKTIAEMQFYIKISDPESWETLKTSELLTLKSSAAGLEQPADDSGDILYDSNGIKIICKGLKQDIIWDGILVFYIENNSGKPVTVYAENVSVNGFMEDTGMWSDLRDGTRIVDGLSLLDLSDLELESIDEVENIELTFRIIHSDTWDEIATTEVISLDFN